MKKILLFAAAALTAVSVNAQKSDASKGSVKFDKSAERVVSFDESLVSNVCLEAKEQEAVEKTTITNRPRKSMATNLYYSAPSGAYYYNWNKAGSGYGPTYIVMPSKTDFTFANHSTNPTTNKWHFNYLSSGSYRDLTEYAEENGNYTSSLRPGYYMAAPTLCDEAQTDSFTIGATTNSYWSKGGSYATYFTRIINDSLFNIGPLDDHCGQYGWGSIQPNSFLYGSGTITNSTYGEGTVVAVSQAYPKPAKALYCEDMYIRGKSAGAVAIPDSVTLYAYIYKYGENKPTYILTATAADVTPGKTYSSSYTSTGTYTYQTVVFSQKTIDPLTGEPIAEPFVIDFAYEVYIQGLDQEGVDLGWNGAAVQDQDAEFYTYTASDGSTAIDNTVFWVKYAETTRGHGYKSTVMAITFDAMFDDVEVLPELTDSEGASVDKCNFVVVAADGETNSSYSSFGENLPGAYVSTLQDWFDGEDNEYYSIAQNDSAEWVYGAVATADNDSYYYVVSFNTEALPEGVEYRYAKIYLQTRAGKLAETPIWVMQGDADKAYEAIMKEMISTGIYVVPTEGSRINSDQMYNVAGQKVANNYKGIVVKNGKKFMNK